MQNPEEPNAEQEPNAEHHVAKILVEVLILRSICGPLKRKLMAFSCHIQLSRVPPRCVMLWRSPEMNFTRRPRVAKLLCIGSPLNRSRDITYFKWVSRVLDLESSELIVRRTDMSGLPLATLPCSGQGLPGLGWAWSSTSCGR